MQSLVREQVRLRDILGSILENRVIPKLHSANSPSSDAFAQSPDGRSTEELRIFGQLVLGGDVSACTAFLKDKIGEGVSLRQLCMGLFTTTAHELGERWLRDELSFAEVTLGLGTLHTLLHKLSDDHGDIRSPGERHNIILASAPAEQHAFGILIVSKIFEMEGWLVTGGPHFHTGQDMTELVENTWFDIIGLTASTEKGAYGLKDEIIRLRAASLNKSICVMVGGNGFANHPSIAKEIGADELANDADDAIRKARLHLRTMEPDKSD